MTDEPNITGPCIGGNSDGLTGRTDKPEGIQMPYFNVGYQMEMEPYDIDAINVGDLQFPFFRAQGIDTAEAIRMLLDFYTKDSPGTESPQQ